MSRTGRNPERHQVGEAFGQAPSEGPALADPVVGDSAVLGLPAVVTIRIPGGQVPGEVRLFVRGGYEQMIAYAQELLEVGRHVVVVTSRGGRAVDVTFSTPGT